MAHTKPNTSPDGENPAKERARAPMRIHSSLLDNLRGLGPTPGSSGAPAGPTGGADAAKRTTLVDSLVESVRGLVWRR
jgi:hypothetical protein